MNILTTLTNVCDNPECLFSVSMILPVLALFALAVITFVKTKYNYIIGLASSAVVALGSIAILVTHSCKLTTTSFAISLLSAILLLIYALKERASFLSKGMFVIRESQNKTYAIILYSKKDVVLAKSKYVYSSIEDARRAISLIQNSKCIQLKGEQNGCWTRFANYPRIETIVKNNKFIFDLTINEDYVILESDSFTSLEECTKKAKEATIKVFTDDVFLSTEMAIIHENPTVDPFLNNITVEKTSVVKNIIEKEVIKETPVELKEPVKEEIMPAIESIEVETNESAEVSEPVAEIKEEPKVEETVVPEPKEENNESNDSDDEEEDENKKEIIVVDGKQMYVTYRKSIFAKVTLAHEITKQYYVELANFISKYPVKRRDSWEFTSYSKSKTTIVKLGVKGKTLFLYLGLPYEEFQKEIFYLKQTTAKAHEKTPTVLCVKSERSLKYAKELIEEVMKRNGLEKDESLEDVESIDTYKEKGIDELIKEGLIKYFFTEIEDIKK